MIWLANGDKVLYQWSRGNVLLANTQFDIFRISREDDQQTVEVTPTKSGMLLRAAIPDRLMTESGYLRVACVVRKNDGETVAESVRFTIRAAQRPKDYVYGSGETADWKVLRAQMNAILRDVREGKFNGLPGKDGATPYIGENKHWYISGIDTGIRAEGLDYILTGDDKDEIAGIVSEAFASLVGGVLSNGIVTDGNDDAMKTYPVDDTEMRVRRDSGTVLIEGVAKTFNTHTRTFNLLLPDETRREVGLWRLVKETGVIEQKWRRVEIRDGGYFSEEDQAFLPIRDDNYYDLLNCYIEIPAGATAITDDMITDLRQNPLLCGFVESKLLDGVVKSVNGIRPDKNGNVTVEVSGGGEGSDVIGELYTDGVFAADDPDALMVTVGGYDEETRINTINMAAGTLIIDGKVFRLPAVSEEYYRWTSASKTVLCGYRYTVSTGVIEAMLWDGYTGIIDQDDGFPLKFTKGLDTIPSKTGDNRDVLCAMINIPSGSLEVTDDMITDLRGVERFCGYSVSKIGALSEAIADKADAKGWTPDKFIGTDAEGNLVEKDAPTGGGAGTVTSVNGVQPDENGNVTVEVGQPTDAQISTAVNTWLDEHPEATTTVADGSVTSEKLADGAVTPIKVANLELIWQPFDPVDYKANGSYKYLNTETGAADKSGGDGWSSPFIGHIKPNQLYTFDFTITKSGQVPRTGIYYYDSEQKFISYTPKSELSNKQFTTPENTAYIKFDTYNHTNWHAEFAADIAKWMICEGDKLYDHYFVGAEAVWDSLLRENTFNGAKLSDETVHGKKIIPGTFEFTAVNGVTTLMQLFDYDEFMNNGVAGGALNKTGGVSTGSTAMYHCSGFVPAKPNQIYTVNFVSHSSNGGDTFLCYDANSEYLGYVTTDGNKQFTTLENTTYIRWGLYGESKIAECGTYMICEGTELFNGYQHGGVKVVIDGLLLDRCTPENTVDGRILLDGSIPSTKIAPPDGFKVLCLGDSLTQGTYPAKVANLLNCEVVDAGVGGNTINAINNRVGNYGTDFNVVTLMCGTNDNGGQTTCPLGTIEDEAATNDNHSELTTTYVSRLKRLLNTIKATHPGAIYILMPPFEHEWGDFEGVVNMMEQIAKLYRIPYLDIFHECGWSGKNEADKAIYMADDTHENAVGAQRIAGMLAGYIRQLTGM